MIAWSGGRLRGVRYRPSASIHCIDGYIQLMLVTLLSDLRSPDPLVRVKAVPRLGDLGATAQEAITSLHLIAQDESQSTSALPGA
jgi:hypothetical protein